MTHPKSVIIEVTNGRGEKELVLVQPTGRMEFAASGRNPERHWLVEVVDTRDMRLKLIACTDIHRWIIPPLAGSAQAPPEKKSSGLA